MARTNTGHPSKANPAFPLASLRGPAVVLGIGLGGFLDGIVLHQILQWHHMLSSSDSDRFGAIPDYPATTVEGLQVNTLWDGLFHLSTYVFVLAGLFWLWRRYRDIQAARPPYRLLVGGLLAGWGLFNLAEGVVDHHVLAVHHVYDSGDPGQTLLYDMLFLAAGAILLTVGWALLRFAATSFEPQP